MGIRIIQHHEQDNDGIKILESEHNVPDNCELKRRRMTILDESSLSANERKIKIDDIDLFSDNVDHTQHAEPDSIDAVRQKYEAKLEDIKSEYEEQIVQLNNRLLQETEKLQELEKQADTAAELRQKLEEMSCQESQKNNYLDELQKEMKQALEDKDQALKERDQALLEADEIRQAAAALQDHERTGIIQELTAEQNEINSLRQQVQEIREEKGEVFQELADLNKRYLQDLRYVEYNQKDGKDRIDGLEAMRRELDDICRELRTLLDNGLSRSYMFQCTHLLNSLDQHAEETCGILEQLFTVVEEFDPVTVNMEIERVTTSEQYKRETEEQLKRLESTLHKMYVIIEKFFVVKNTISFHFDQ